MFEMIIYILSAFFFLQDTSFKNIKIKVNLGRYRTEAAVKRRVAITNTGRKVRLQNVQQAPI